MGLDDHGLLRQPCAGVVAAANSGLRRRESALDVLSHPRRADERRAAICLRQAVRQDQDRPGRQPPKTVDGFVGGAASATLIGAAMWWITPFTPLQSDGMAFVIVLMGFLGGLVLSAVKRSLGAKDWGSMIEGHGGMMDRMDSDSFAAPIFFHATRYFFT